MAGKISLPHHSVVVQWKEEKVIKWLRRVHLDDCIPAFEIRHIDGSKLLELTEQKLFTYQDMKIKHRKQIAKCVQECKSQASNAKRIARTIKHGHASHNEEPNADYDSDDSDGWGTDFEDNSEDEGKEEQSSLELNNNIIVKSPSDTSSGSSPSLSTFCGKSIPKPPDIPVISKNAQISAGQKNCNNSIPRPPLKRPPSQPPPPPVSQITSFDEPQEDYEIPIVSTSSGSRENTDFSDNSLQSITSNESSLTETYELIDPPEEAYEMVDAPLSSLNVTEKPVLPPRYPVASAGVSPPPPLPQKPRKLKDTISVLERSDGVRTFSRPKLPVKSEDESTPEVPPQPSNVGFISSLIGRRSSTTPSSSPKIQHKNKDCNDGPFSSNVSVLSSNEAHSSRSSSPDKEGSDLKKVTPLPPLPPRTTLYGSEDTAQNMATRPLPPVPIPKELTPTTKQQDIMIYPWYHEIERQDAEEVVKSLNDSGSFVVRPSKRAGKDNPYSLTILHERKLFHLNIRQRPDNTFALGKEKKKEKTFTTVSELIAFHQTEPILLTSRGEPAGRTILSKYPEKS